MNEPLPPSRVSDALSLALFLLKQSFRRWKTMNICVLNNVGASRQTRAYAEYRVFAGLACVSRLVQDVEVQLNPSNGDGGDISCVITVETTSGRQARVRARGRHAYDAINRAAERTSQRLWELANADTLIRDAR